MTDAARPDLVYRLDPHVRFRRLFDEAVVLHQERAETLVLNDTGVAFLELCDGRRSTGEIITAMSEQFEVEAQTLARDLAPFLAELLDANIIHGAEAAKP